MRTRPESTLEAAKQEASSWQEQLLRRQVLSKLWQESELAPHRQHLKGPASGIRQDAACQGRGGEAEKRD